MSENKIKTASILLSVGLAFVFLYAAIDSFFNPANWIGFFPIWMRGIASDKILLSFFSVYEIFLALWLLSRRKIFYAGLASALTAAGIVIFNIGSLEIVFRDVAMIFVGLALAALNRESK